MATITFSNHTTRTPGQPIQKNWVIHVIETVARWHDRAAQRRALAGLGEDALHDIALSRADVARETGKPFWKA